MYLRFVCFQGVFEIAMRGVALRQSFLVMLDTEKALQPPHLQYHSGWMNRSNQLYRPRP